MNTLYIILISFSLGLVAFVNAFWGGIYRCLCFSEILKMITAFMIFLAGMFWVGTWSGHSFANALGWMAIPIAETILLLLGIKITYYGMRNRPEQKSYNLAKNGELIAVSFASSLNAFIAGLGFGMLRPATPVFFYAIAASVVFFSYLGVTLGKNQGRFIFARLASLLSGVALIILVILLGVKLFGLK